MSSCYRDTFTPGDTSREWCNALCVTVYLRRLLACLAFECLKPGVFRGHPSRIHHPINLLDEERIWNVSCIVLQVACHMSCKRCPASYRQVRRTQLLRHIDSAVRRRLSHD